MLVGATTALFSDTETSGGNILSAGTIDIAVDGENPWTKTYSDHLEDVKPCQEREVTFVIKNVGANPLRLWKHLKDIENTDNLQSEPECGELGGTWHDDPTAPWCDYGVNQSEDGIDTVIDYDLYVGGGAIIHGDDGITVDDIESHYIYLTELQPDQEVEIKQSYHMRADTANWAQGDKMTFDIELYAEQATDQAMGPFWTTLLMDNKDAGWNRTPGDGTYGILAFPASIPIFVYEFIGRGLEPNTDYSLIYYADPYPGCGQTCDTGVLLGSGMTDGSGVLPLSGAFDLGTDLPNSDDTNYPSGAKIWLIPSAYYDSSNHKLSGWPADRSKWLFEYRLIKYKDTDL